MPITMTTPTALILIRTSFALGGSISNSMILNGVFMSNKTAALLFMALPNINKKTVSRTPERGLFQFYLDFTTHRHPNRHPLQ